MAMRRRRLAWGIVGVTTVVLSTAFAVATLEASAEPTPGSSPGAAAAPSTVSNPSPGPAASAGVEDDPLTKEEVNQAKTVAMVPLTESAKDVTGAKGPEYLSAEIVVGGTGRDAAVYFYDYSTDELVKQVVDVTGGKVTGSFKAKQMQLPASDREVATAVDLLLADAAGTDVRALYTKVTGKPWTGKDQLKVEAHIYHAQPADTAAAKCGEHRCLQLVARVTDGPFVDLNDIIIDLSGRTVVRVK